MPIQDVQQLTNKQHAVPQNIMDVEFKIIGDLTMRQFAYLLVFGGFAYVSYAYIGGIFKWPFLIGSILLGLSLAFVPIEDRGADQWVINFIKAVYAPNQRIWHKEAVIPSVFLYESLAVVQQELITLAPTSSRRKLEEYLESGNKNAKVDTLDIPEQLYIEKVRNAFATSTERNVDIGTYKHVATAPVSTIKTTTNVATSDKIPSVETVAQLKSIEHKDNIPTSGPTTKPKPISTPIKELQGSNLNTKMLPSHITAEIIKPSHIASNFNLPGGADEAIILTPLTPDRHSGRRFNNLLPTSGTITLPQKLNITLSKEEETYIETDMKEMATQLEKLVEQLKNDNNYTEVIINKGVGNTLRAVPQTGSVSLDNRGVNLLKEKEQINREKEESLKMLDNLQQSKVYSQNEYDALKQQITQLQNKIRELQDREQSISLQTETIAPTQVSPAISSLSATPSANVNVPQGTNQPNVQRPNIVYGTVKNKQGGFLEGVILVIKKQGGDPVRALKTNSLGQFYISTPLTNGNYVIEVDKSNKTSYSFTDVTVQATGNLLAPIEFIGN